MLRPRALRQLVRSRRAAASLPPRTTTWRAGRTGFGRRKARQGWAKHTASEQRQLNAFYHAEITMIDDLVGRVLDRLDEHGQAENTLVVFTSDHATPVGYHGFVMHGGPALYEDVLRVPCAVRWPAGLPAGRACDGPFQACRPGADVPRRRGRRPGSEPRPRRPGDAPRRSPRPAGSELPRLLRHRRQLLQCPGVPRRDRQAGLPQLRRTRSLRPRRRSAGDQQPRRPGHGVGGGAEARDVRRDGARRRSAAADGQGELAG
ncbi:MAG: sulfatase-like hydrolase/transferase [Gammaproteobacteria bacterium]|nr:sulfatase-like hydrolase/transferase [Gammaproteobacteria bacterium]